MRQPLKILWIARTCPVPANDGEKLRVFNLLKALAERHDLTVIFRVIEPEEQAGIAELRKFCKAVHGVQVDRPKGMLERLRWALPFVLSRYPVSLCTVYFKAIADVLSRLAAELRFDIVQVEHSSLSIYLDRVQFAGASAKVLTMHNIDYIRNDRLIASQPPGLMRLYHQFDQARFKAWELSALGRFDQVIAMSEIDRTQLLQDRPGLQVKVVPNGVDVHRIAYSPLAVPVEKLVFVASMDSEANHDGAMYFLRDVWPLLKQLRPAMKIAFVGRAPRPELRAAHNGQDIVVIGKVDDVFGYYRDAVAAIVPLRSGGGTRLKILEAMAIGTAVVSTSIGCEGLDVLDQQHLHVADTATAFAQAIVSLLEDDAARVALLQRARALVETQYDWGLIASKHDLVYSDALRHVSR